MTSDLTMHRGTQPVMLCSWIQRACRAVVRASLYLQRDGQIVGKHLINLVMSSLTEQTLEKLPGAGENQSR